MCVCVCVCACMSVCVVPPDFEGAVIKYVHYLINGRIWHSIVYA